MIDKELIEGRLQKFWGYGNLDAPVWFVGMDERLDPLEGQEMLEKQFRYAEGNMIDGMLGANRSRANEWKHLANMGPFLPGAELQATWKYPIALYLYLRSRVRLSVDERVKVLREYQIKMLADADKKETATLELSPLPCPSTREEDWLYGDYDVKGLSSRKEYEKNYLHNRALRLRELIQGHTPKLVIFYSMGYLPHWEEVMGVRLQKITRRTLFAGTQDTAFCIIPNGGQSGLSYNELYEYADEIRGRINL